ncbi:hypothetical protein N9058_00995 [bacterium]|nr:hypothetical protein [bacterium]
MEFFLHLAEHIRSSFEEVNIQFWTMQLSAADALTESEAAVVYLPKAFESEPYELDDVSRLDKSFAERGMKGLAVLYGLERFKPAPEQAEEFIARQAVWFERNTPPESIMVGLTLEHFCYICSAQINLCKGGENYFPIPMGFPIDGVALHKTPWEMNYFREDPLPVEIIDQYTESLKHPPEVTINYMKKQKFPSLLKSMSLNLKLFCFRFRILKTFGYLEPSATLKIPTRMEFKKIKFDGQYFDLERLKKLSQGCQLFYYPLQFEPEMSILAYSPFYREQIEMIRLVSEAINLGDWLVLKENPKMHGRRSASFYESVMEFPNVIWAHPDCNSRDLIRISSKVVTISGTAAVEAATLGRSSLLFGHLPSASLLYQPPVVEQPLQHLKRSLYTIPNSKEILAHLNEQWKSFSKCILIGNYLPAYNGERTTTQNTEELAEEFFNEVFATDK